MSELRKVNVEDLQMNPFTKVGKDWMLVTAGDAKKANAMTASWGGLGIMWGENVAFVFIRQTRYTKEFMDQQKKFSLSFPSEEYREAMKYLGAVSGRDEDKWEKSGLHTAVEDGVPYIEEADLVLNCEIMSNTVLPMADMVDDSLEAKWYGDGNLHTMYIAKITSALQR